MVYNMQLGLSTIYRLKIYTDVNHWGNVAIKSGKYVDPSVQDLYGTYSLAQTSFLSCNNCGAVAMKSRRGVSFM